MSESAIPRRSGGPVEPPRFVPPLPAGIPILYGQARTRWRLPRGLVILLVLGALFLYRLHNRHSSSGDERTDYQRIDAVMTQAMLAHAPKGARIPVILASGPRFLQIEYAIVQYPQTRIGGMPGGSPTTCVMVTVLDPKTGAKDPNYESGNLTCIEGLAYRIH